MKNKYIIGILAVAIIAIVGTGLVSAFNFGGKGMMNQDLRDEEIAEMGQHREAVQKAIEDKDYETWKSLMESQLTQENFNIMVERHGQMSEMRELRQELRQAIEDGDTEKVEGLKDQIGEAMPFKNAEGCPKMNFKGMRNRLLEE